MANERKDPLRNFRFRVEIDGEEYGFSEVTGGDITLDAIDYRNGNEPIFVRKLPGLTKFGNVTMKWGITDSTKLHDWHREIVEGNVTRKPVTVTVLNERGEDAARYEILEAWPCKYDPIDLNAKGNDVGIETLELCNEGVKRVVTS
jgi:phage tail-like protein